MLRVVDLATEEGDQRFRQIRTRLLNEVSVALADVDRSSCQDDGRHPASSTRSATAGVLVSMLAHVAAHRYGFEFWGIRTGDLRTSMARQLYWGTTGQKPPSSLSVVRRLPYRHLDSVPSTSMTVDAERLVAFDQVFNFRDLGGYQTADGRVVRWRTLFRADGVHRLTIDDIAPLGVRTVLDLRTPTELDERGRFTHDSVGYHHLPILEKTWDASALNVESTPPSSSPLAISRCSKRAATASAGRCTSSLTPRRCPLVFHCAAGKDRTGVVAAIVLDVLGVQGRRHRRPTTR